MSTEWGTDTNLDAIAALVRTHPEPAVARIAPLLEVARREPHGTAFNTLVEHHLGRALNGAMARRDRGIDVVDLFQEGSVAVVVALEEFTAREGTAAQLGAYVDRVVALHLDAAIEREAVEVAAERQLVFDAEVLQTARVMLQRELGRSPTELEMGGMVQWPAERVAAVNAALQLAETTFDADIVQYLEDVDEDDAGDADDDAGEG